MAEKFKVMIFDKDLQSLRNEKYIQIYQDSIETSGGLYPIGEAKKFYNESDGYVYYIFNLDLPAKVEASNLKTLRRSAAVSNIFNYDNKKPFDLIGFMPWIVIIVMAIFM